MKRVTPLLILFAVLGVFSVYQLFVQHRFDFIRDYFSEQEHAMLFVGDVMLARNVEDRVREVGTATFFDRVRTLHERAQFVVGNFEASIPKTHTQTADFTFQFSMDALFVPMLTTAGFTHFSQANNHSNDYGTEGYENARALLLQNNLEPFGSYGTLATSSIAYALLEETNIALIAVHAVVREPSLSELKTIFSEARKNSDIQIVVVHWGDEYQQVHNRAQEALAETFVDFGADVVIGHHPHVVQDIGLIEGVPIFYSLGNYVFDQYWNEDVRRGLAVLMREDGAYLEFELIPTASDKSIPTIMESESADAFLRSIADRSEQSLQSDIVRGTFRVRK